MAITNAQQFKQLVNPPMKGKKRPGYRGEAAAASDAAAGRNAGRSGPSGVDDRSNAGQTAVTKAANMMGRMQNQNLNEITNSNLIEKFPTRNIRAIDRINLDRMINSINLNNTITDDDDEEQILAGASLFDTIRNAPDYKNRIDAIKAGINSANVLSTLGKAEGGSMNDQIRQAYGLGSIVKKATSAVKKVVKSPVGKAALVGGLSAYGLGALGAKSFAPSAAFNLGNIGKGFAASKGFFADKLLGPMTYKQGIGERAGGLLSKLGIGSAITAVSLLPLLGIGTGEETEEEAQAILQGQGINIDAIKDALLAHNIDTPNGGNEQAFKSSWTVDSSDVSANKVILAFFRKDTENSHYSLNITVKYHLR